MGVGDGLPMSHSVIVPAISWEGAKAGRCYGNVKEMVRQFGGTFAFGWALGEYGPSRLRCQSPPPLYRRWVNHVVWRDALGKLWEVSPNVSVARPDEVHFVNTEFWEDPTATFRPNSDGSWFLTKVRYVAVRPEGHEVAASLTHAQTSDAHGDKLYWLERAISGLITAGFSPTEWIMHSIGAKTGSIWLFAE
jgi:hypothetical protein